MKGLDRFVEGTQRDPDVFQVLQNMFIPNPGELRTLNGVTKLQNAIPGLQKITHAKFLDTNKEKGLVVYYEPSTSLPSAPGANFTFSTSGGGAVSRDVYVEYLISGQGTIGTLYAATSIQANGLTITINNAVNGSAYYAVQSINVYVADASGNVTWAGSAWREAGSFPSTMVVFPPGAQQTSALVSIGIPPGTFTAIPNSVGGTGLESDRLYYFGLGPWVGNAGFHYTECAFKTASNNLPLGTTASPQIFSCYVPNGKNSIDFTFDYCPLNPPDSFTLPTSTDIVMSRAIVYIGLTPEDLMPCSNGVGYASTFAKTSPSMSFNNVTALDFTADTIKVTGPSGQVPVGAALKLVINSGTITNLATNTYYYVVSSLASGSDSIIKIAFSPGGTPIDLTASTAGTSTFSWAQYTGTVRSLPKSLDRIPSCAIWNSDKTILYPKAVPGRGVGVTLLTPFTNPNGSILPSKIACGIFTSLDFSFANFRHIAQPVAQNSANLDAYNNVTLSSDLGTLFVIPINYPTSSGKFDWNFESRQYGNRLWSVNNYNEPFYTNGYVFKSGIPSDSGTNEFHRWPITKFIEFYKDRMILASDNANQSYAQGYFYYSMLSTGSGDIQDFSYISTTPNTIPINTSDQSVVNGLNVYSQDLTSVGASAFLIVGKQASVFSWDGDVSHPAQQITRATGFAGPKCYALSKFGPVYVGRDNVYLFRSSQDVIPIGDNVKDIISGLTNDQLNAVTVQFHDQDIKIGYTDSSNIDKELWLRMVYKGSAIARQWSGPHAMTPYTGVTTILSFDNQINVRVSYDDTDFFRRDDPGSFSNNSQPIARSITISNMGLQYDQFLKLITEVKLALRTTQDENFLITLESEDGSESIVVSSDLTTSGNQRRFKTIQIPQRFLARVLKISIENTSQGDLSIYDFSVLFQQIKRRLLP